MGVTTYCQFVAWLEPFRANEDIETGRVEDLGGCHVILAVCSFKGEASGDEGGRRVQTNKRRVARVVNVQQVAIEIHVLVPAYLDGGIGGLLSHGAGRERHLGIYREWRERDLGQALGGELCGVGNDDILNFRMGRPGPVGCKWCHCVTVRG